jgi:hypothetical protein
MVQDAGVEMVVAEEGEDLPRYLSGRTVVRLHGEESEGPPVARRLSSSRT